MQAMWAPPVILAIPWPPNSLSAAAVTPSKISSLSVSAKHRRRWQRQYDDNCDYDEKDDDDNGGQTANLGEAVDAIAISITTTNSRQPKQQQQDKSLSGADVLRALQRASAQKSEKKKAQIRNSSSVSKGGGGGRDVPEQKRGEALEARPICIKSEWCTRLDELERRLLDLTDSLF